MESEKPMPEFSGATLQRAFAALEEYLLFRDGQAPIEQQTMMPPPPEEPRLYIQPLSLNLVERMHLEAALLKNPELREDAADSLVELAESVDCTVPTARRILDTLEFKNNECNGALSPQVRKAKKALEMLAGRSCFSNSKEDLEMEKRDTLPFSAKPGNSGSPKQNPKPPAVDTTEKIHKSKAKR